MIGSVNNAGIFSCVRGHQAFRILAALTPGRGRFSVMPKMNLKGSLP